VDFPLEGNPINAARSISPPAYTAHPAPCAEPFAKADQPVGWSEVEAATGCGEDVWKAKM